MVSASIFDGELISRLSYWIMERESIRHAKEAGKCPPWTIDDILNTYRFCNVHREDDAVTRWIRANWMVPNEDHADLWFNVCIARLINNPPSLYHVGYFGMWDEDVFVSSLSEYRDTGARVFNPAYIVSTNGVSKDKVLYLAQDVLSPMWDARRKLRPKEDDTLSSYYRRLSAFKGMGSFMSSQVIADLKYVYPLQAASDWHAFATSGPGSRRGMNRLLGAQPTNSISEKLWYSKLIELQSLLASQYKIQLHAQDLQNCLCEFDKYMRVRLGEGTPKQKYTAKRTRRKLYAGYYRT